VATFYACGLALLACKDEEARVSMNLLIFKPTDKQILEFPNGSWAQLPK